MATAGKSHVSWIIPLIVTICLVNTSAQGQTSRYIFLSDQSTLVQTGGIAGVHWTYAVEGQFLVVVDSEAGTASFAQVDANAVDDSPLRRTLDPNEVFNMTALAGTLVDGGTSIRFEGSADDASSVLITLTFADDTVILKGQTTPPPNSADFFIFTLDAVAKRKYGGGAGEPNDPYQIATAAHMNAIGANPGDWGMHFKLMADVDLSGFDGKNGRPGYNIVGPDTLPGTWEYDGTPFTGVFDGNGHVVLHLTITGERYLGLFGLVGSRAVVKNLGVVAADITGSNDIGAIVGGNGYLQIRYIQAGILSGCYSTGAVTGDDCVGGLVGRNYGTVTDCYSTVTVSADAWVGGLVGSNDDGIVTECYSTGVVTGADASTVGGLVGFSPGIVLRCIWDMQTSGQLTSAGGVGLTTVEMMDAQVLGLNGFGGDPNWVLDPGHDYPRLAWEGTPGGIIPEPIIDWLEGRGTADAPYRLRTTEHLILLGKAGMLWDKHLVLSADIDLQANPQGEHVFGQAVIPVFTGVFDGNGHTISHLMIRGQSFLGLVGQLRSGAKVKNLGVVDVNVTGSGNYIGGLVANNSGAVTNCHSTGVLSGGAYVGGLVGYSDYRGTVTGCHSAGAVRGYTIGGLVGYNEGPVTQCYSTGVVTGADASPVGGLVGYTHFGTVTASFWDIATSGWATSDGGTGKTTAEMQTAATFLEAGWDFVDETVNGTEDIWWILEGQDYPRLWWEARN